VASSRAPAAGARADAPATWHAGERAVQVRVGEAGRADRSLGGIRAEIPPVAAEFLLSQRILAAGGRDAAGRVWCSLLAGPPGFARARDARTLDVAALPAPGDPLAGAFAAGPAAIGLLALEPQTRRRMRVNGTAQVAGGGLQVHTDAVYSNCPKYIQVREVTEEAGTASAAPRRAVGAELTGPQRAFVSAADTFFIATAEPGGGADASHRGGSPGFVSVRDATTLSWPDYTGNSMYMTLGNLELDPRAGLLFVDWDGGATLQLTGRATVDFSPARAAAIPGAHRVVDFAVDEVVELSGRPLAAWRLVEPSRFNPPAPPAGS
jgi:predicted pyridoxine 5'-phosphate oxidase superfamily flavin-nucleotide-binding protein